MIRLTWIFHWCAALSAAWLFASSPVLADEAVHGEGADPMTASNVQLEQAQARFARAKELYEANEYEQAMEEFKASRAIVASPNTRLYQARCLRELGRLLEAYAIYGRTMIDAMELAKMEARYGRTAEAARTEREELEARLSFVKLNVHNASPGTKLVVNGEEIRRTAWSEPVVALPGKVQVELATEGQPTQSRLLELQPGETQEITLSVESQPQATHATEPEPATSPAKSVQERQPAASLAPYAYTAAAVGVVGFGAFGAFGVSSKQKYDELNDACVSGACPSDQAQTLDDGKKEQLWANIGLAVGVVGSVAAVTLFILDPDDEESSVALVVAPGALTLRGTL